MKIEIEVESPKMLIEKLNLAQYAVLKAGDTDDVHDRFEVASALASLIREVGKHRPTGADGKHGNLHTETCGCEDKPADNPLGIRDYVGTFYSGFSQREVIVNVQGVQWDGTQEMAEKLREWVEGVSPYQGLQYHSDRDESLRINGPFLVLGVGNDFGDFDIAVKDDFLYLTERHFSCTSPDRFFQHYKEATK